MTGTASKKTTSSGRKTTGASSGRKTGTRTKSSAKTGRTSTGTRSASDKPALTKEQYALRQEIKAIIIFALAILLFACNFGVIGRFGNAVSDIMFGLFGVLAYVFPLLLGGCIVYLLVNVGSSQSIRKTVAAFVLMFAVGNLIDLFSGISKSATVYDLKAFFESGMTGHTGGGVISASVTFLLRSVIETAGTVIFSIVLIIVCLIIITERSLLNSVRNTKELIAARTENERNLREQLRISQAEENARRQEERYIREQERLELEEKKRKAEAELKNMGDRFKVGNEVTVLTDDDGSSEVIAAGPASESSADPDAERVLAAADRLKMLNLKDAKKEAKADREVLKRNKKLSGITDDTLITPPLQEMPGKGLGDVHEIVLDNFDPETLTYTGTDSTEAVPSAEKGKREEVISPVSGRTVDTHGEDIHELTPPVIRETPAKPSKPAETVENDIRKEILNSDKTGEYVFPPLKLLKPGSRSKANNAEHIRETSAKLVSTLKTFGIEARVSDTSIGPTVTRYELSIGVGTKVSKIKGLSDDIKLSLAATDIRMEVPIPGKSAIGIEIPNKDKDAVAFRDLIDCEDFKKNKSVLTFAIGKDIAGKNIIYDIDQFPHLLIAGATGSGKSVCINTLIMSILYKANPDAVKLIMIDPKVVELSVYNGIPHLLLPVVTDAKKASATLNYAVAEMMERYKKFADMNCRDLNGYNRAVSELPEDDPCKEMHRKLPRIVIIVDELADLIMVAKNEVEDSICRIAQLARACGIHLVIATQRPSVDVITGLIKANMPSRIAFAVSSGIDSRTILDMTGAEELLGKGDMLFFPKGLKKPVRLQGGYVSDEEVNDVVAFLRSRGSAEYDANIDEKINSMAQSAGRSGPASAGAEDDNADDMDDRFVDAARFVIESDKASIGHLQRKFKMGFNRAARLMDQLYEAGIVGPETGTKPREVIMSMEQFENRLEQGEF